MATALHDRRGAPSRRRSAAVRSAKATGEERPLWQIVALLYSAIAFLAVFLIAACYLAAYLATGSPY